MANINPNNNVTIQGRLGKDSVLRYTNDKKPVLNLSVAISNDWYDEEKQDWVKADPTWMNVTVWGQAAERYSKELVKGALVRVMGKLSTRKRTIEQDVSVSRKTIKAQFEITETYITASSIQIVRSRSEAANSQVRYEGAAVTEPDF
jgi:single stranded DNA-binding protein